MGFSTYLIRTENCAEELCKEVVRFLIFPQIMLAMLLVKTRREVNVMLLSFTVLMVKTIGFLY